ncbi:PepSY-associated TM helix domain-containing protein [Methylobacter sp.]|uniref:PepSY-associated TM helix domain-containing protein n=1 Tax=Methylobacter sp. TaxID=2051955 RepID=UPI003DA6C446
MQRTLTRQTWLKIHLYLALIAGFFFALMGLTGSVSVYREELDELLNPQLVIELPQGKYQSLDRIMASVRQAHPDRHGAWTLEMPRSPYGMVTAWYDKPRETFFELHAPLMVSVNPYTAEVVSSRFWGQTVTTWLLDLHTQLRLDRFGWNAVGIMGLLLMVSIGTGLYLWWPDMRQLRQAFTIRHDAGMVRLAFDLHRFIGLFSAAALLALAFTGLLLSYPAVLESLAGASGMAHGETGRNIISTAVPNSHPTGLAAATFMAQGPFPHAELRRITTPVGDSGIYRVNLRQPGEINQRHPYTTVWVDRWSGQIKEVRNPADFSAGETLASWIWPLHTGEALNGTGRFLWFLAGQSLFVLYISGLLHWLYRRGKIRDRKVDFAALRPFFYRLAHNSHRIGLMLFRYLVLLAQKARPFVAIGVALLLQQFDRLRAAMANRQKRIGH